MAVVQFRVKKYVLRGARHFDLFRFEPFVNVHIQIVDGICSTVKRWQERSEDKRHAAIHIFQRGRGSRFLQHDGMLLCDLQQQLSNLLWFVPAANDHADRKSIDSIAERPVQQLSCDEFLVGDDQFLTITINNRRGSKPDA